MKKLLILSSLLVAMSIASYALPLCTNVTLASLLSGGANATGCQVSDKQFSNFQYTGDIAATNVNVAFQTNGAIPAGATIQFQPSNGAQWAALTNLSWTTSIDTTSPASATSCPTCQFISVLDQIFTPPTPNTNAGTFTHSGGGSVNVSGTSPATLSGQAVLSGLTTTNDKFVQTGGSTLQSISASYSQTSVPEPVTMSLMGAGLLAVGLLGRRLRRQ